MNYDVIIPLVKRNINAVHYSIKYLKFNLPELDSIFIIGERELENEFNNEDIIYIDEDKIIDGLTLENCRLKILEKDKYAGKRAGWYLQQFVKMAYSFHCAKEYYLVWDADTILLNKISMFDDNDQPYFDMKTECHYPYFATIKRLFREQVNKTTKKSYISEHMIIKTEYMHDMIKTISRGRKEIEFWEVILDEIDNIEIMMSGFSEFETYGNYVDTFYSKHYQHRELRTCRNAEREYGNIITGELLNRLSQEYDTVTFENRHRL